MAKKPTYGGYKPPPKPKEAAAPRSLSTEQALCSAIGSLSEVELKYRDDINWRTYQPHCVYYSTADPSQVNVFGELTRDGNDSFAKLGPRELEVGRITDLRITNAQFQRPSNFDRFAAKFKGGIICCV